MTEREKYREAKGLLLILSKPHHMSNMVEAELWYGHWLPMGFSSNDSKLWLYLQLCDFVQNSSLMAVILKWKIFCEICENKAERVVFYGILIFKFTMAVYKDKSIQICLHLTVFAEKKEQKVRRHIFKRVAQYLNLKSKHQSQTETLCS